MKADGSVPSVYLHPDFEAALKRTRTESDSTGPLAVRGNVHDDDMVWHLTGIDDRTESRQHVDPTSGTVGVYLGGDRSDSKDVEGVVQGYIDSGRVAVSSTEPFLLISGESPVCEYTLATSNDGIVRVRTPIEPTRLRVDRLFVRVDDDDYPREVLANKRVAVIGLGSGGSAIALALAKTGVRRFVFVDGDRLKEHNVVRHVCGLDDVGRLKTRAVRDHLLARVPDVDVTVYDGSFDRSTAAAHTEFCGLLGDVDLIVACAAEQTTNYSLDAFAEELSIPVIYGGMFEGLRGGIAIRVDPSQSDVSYRDIYRDVVVSEDTPQVSRTDLEGTYQSAEEEDQGSQIGLGLEVEALAHVITRMCLSHLLRGVESPIYDLSEQVYVLANDDLTIGGFRPNRYYQIDPFELTAIPRSEFESTGPASTVTGRAAGDAALLSEENDTSPGVPAREKSRGGNSRS
jgi:molybdopterin/thiamine biosynthesis adenylyltransferase